MSHVAWFAFNPFQENTYVVYDDTKECVIIDPGCYNAAEEQKLAKFIEEKGLTPVKLIQTHCHVDHVLGNNFIKKTYNIPIYMHKAELPVLQAVPNYGAAMGLPVKELPEPDHFMEAGTTIGFGNTEFDIRFTPGHSPGSVSFYCQADNYVIAGDVLFAGSIGRTDLPGGDFDTLEDSIKRELYVLPDETTVYCGHGPQTTIGREKTSNPFVRA